MMVDVDAKSGGSLFARLLSRQRPLWVTIGIALLLVLIPVGAAFLDGTLGDLWAGGLWRHIMLPSAVILYILIVAPHMARMDVEVIEALRPLVLIDGERFDRLVTNASRLNPVVEVIVFLAGAVCGLWFSQMWFSDEDVLWLKLCITGLAGLMFGLLVWTIYAAVAGTRLTSKLHRQPLRVDIFDAEAFRPVGRQSLIIALVFVGGILLSMVFSLGPENVLDWRNWLLYFLMALVPVSVFFLNMRDTHRVLVTEKKRELTAVQSHIVRACRALAARVEEEKDTGSLAAEINALVAYEARLQAASTWPYDTAMLRTLFFSVIIPGGAALVRAGFDFLSN